MVKRKVKEELKTIDEKEVSQDADDAEEEEFFNQDSYNDYIQKIKLDIFNPDRYINNKIHKEEIIIPREYRKTSEIMSPYEYPRIISERAKQIENGSVIFVDIKNEFDPIKIAEMEIKQKKCPLKIIRHYNSFMKEVWDVNEMIIPFK